MGLEGDPKITIDPQKRGGKPCIRGLRISVFDILDWLRSGMTVEDIIHDYPELKEQDIIACLECISEKDFVKIT